MPSIYLCKPSREPRRPVIDFMWPENEANDWGKLDKFMNGVQPLSEAPEIEVVVRHSAATEWDSYSIPVLTGTLSERAVELLGRFGPLGLEFVPMRLNRARFYLPRVTERIDRLDVDRSQVTRFREPPHQIWMIERYVFNLSRLGTARVFAIPDKSASLFVTDTVADAIRQAGLRGFQLDEVYRE